MVKTLLVDQDLNEGRLLLEWFNSGNGEGTLTWGNNRVVLVDRPDVRIKAAFWWYVPESEEWRLVVATPLVDEVGPLAAYGVIQAHMTAIKPPVSLTLRNISLISPKDPRVKAFKKAMKVAPDPFGVRFTRSALNGTYVEDAYVYRLPSTTAIRR